MSKVALYLEVPVENPYDKDSFKIAVDLLAEHAIQYGKLVEKNPNIVIADTVLIMKPEDYMNRADTPVNLQLAEAMSHKGPGPKPAKKKVEPVVIRDEEDEAESDEGPPVVQAKSVAEYKSTKAKAIIAEEADQEKSVVTVKSTVVPTPDAAQELTDKIFEKLSRTKKSVTIISAFAKAGKEMTLEELMKVTKLNKNDVSSWLNQTGKTVKAIVKLSRGLYKFDPDQV